MIPNLEITRIQSLNECQSVTYVSKQNFNKFLKFLILMKTNLIMIDIRYAKEVLTKVSFERSIFKRELEKFINIIQPEQHSEFKEWCIAKFSQDHQEVIQNAFKSQLLNLEP